MFSYWGPTDPQRDPLLPHDHPAWEKYLSKGWIRGYFITFPLFKHQPQRLPIISRGQNADVHPEGDSSHLFARQAVKKSVKE